VYKRKVKLVYMRAFACYATPGGVVFIFSRFPFSEITTKFRFRYVGKYFFMPPEAWANGISMYYNAC